MMGGGKCYTFFESLHYCGRKMNSQSVICVHTEDRFVPSLHGVFMKTQTTKTTPASTILSETLLPAIKGEFYDYDYKFLSARPVFALLKCKSQKGRPIEQLSNLGPEANILFCFGKKSQVSAHSINFANELNMLSCTFENDFFGKTYLGATSITLDEFNSIRNEEDVATLVAICKEACSKKLSSIELKEGSLFAVTTDTGKYGLFSVQTISDDSVLISACHILL